MQLCFVPPAFLDLGVKGEVRQQNHHLIGTQRNPELALWLCPNQLCGLEEVT